MWNESFQFDIHVPELAMVQFVVEDYDSTSQNDLVGQYCQPLTSVQNGKKVQLKQFCFEVSRCWIKSRERDQWINTSHTGV